MLRPPFHALLLSLAFTGSAAAQEGVVPGTAVPEPADWAVVGQEAAQVLSAYLQVDTINPEGNETRGARFLAEVLAAEGIGSQIHESAPGRGNLVARLPGSGAEAPICLLSHIDVAEAEADSWPEGKGPLSGTIDEDGLIWGRGALDMKGMGVVELQALVELHRRKVPLKRDLVLLAVADEEVANTGMKWVVEHLWEELGCSHLVNEGGVGFQDMFFDGQQVYPISVGEKGVLWLRMVASAEPGHGSTPLPERSPELLMAAVQRLSQRKPKPTWHPSLLELLDNVGAHHGGIPGTILGSPLLVKSMLRARLMGHPLTRAAITDTVNVTGFGGALQPNVVPGESWANIDVRYQPGTDPDALLAELVALVDDPRVRLEVLAVEPSAVSEWQGDVFYEALATRAVEGLPGAVAGPVISVGFTDSIYVRPLGVRAYGFVPFVITAEQAATMHGNGEHVSIANLGQGVRVLYRALVDVAADPEGTWVAPMAPPEPEPEPEPEPGPAAEPEPVQPK